MRLLVRTQKTFYLLRNRPYRYNVINQASTIIHQSGLL